MRMHKLFCILIIFKFLIILIEISNILLQLQLHNITSELIFQKFDFRVHLSHSDYKLMISYFAGVFRYENFFPSILILLTNLNVIQHVRWKSRYVGPGLEFAKDFHILVSIYDQYQLIKRTFIFELRICYIRNMHMLVLVKCKRFFTDFCLADCVL